MDLIDKLNPKCILLVTCYLRAATTLTCQSVFECHLHCNMMEWLGNGVMAPKVRGVIQHKCPWFTGMRGFWGLFVTCFFSWVMAGAKALWRKQKMHQIHIKVVWHLFSAVNIHHTPIKRCRLGHLLQCKKGVVAMHAGLVECSWIFFFVCRGNGENFVA